MIEPPSSELARGRSAAGYFFPVLAFVAFVFGFIGFRKAFPGTHFLTTLYSTLQMFALESPDNLGKVNWQLHIGRLLAALFLAVAGLRIFFAVVRRDWRELTLLLRCNHIVICGLGELGLPLALEARRKGNKPVAVEKNALAPGVEAARRAGIPVIVGDACNPRILRRARVHKAREVLGLCADDGTNLGIAALLAGDQVIPPGTRRGLRCRLVIGNPTLREALRRNPPAPREGLDVDSQGLDIHALRARQALNENPLDHRPLPEPEAGVPPKTATLILVGFGEMGQALALQAARVGHFASGEKLRIIVVESDADRRVAEFCLRIPNLPVICDIRGLEGTLRDGSVSRNMRAIMEEAQSLDQPVTVAICRDDRDADNVSAALDLSSADWAMAPYVRILVYLTTDCGYSHWFPADGAIRPFGMRERIWNYATLLDEKQDRVARHLHQAYLMNEGESRIKKKAAGIPAPLKPAECPWETLPERFRVSSRAQADHIPIKARALGFHIAPLASGRPEDRVADLHTKEKTEMLARLEHRRWCANLWVDGWRLSPERDDEKLQHPLLKPWEFLTREDQYIDEKMIAASSAALEKDGLGIFR